ncbi:MAG TPA: DUF1127 domain-containing protein [Hyphomicrobiales bacterium]|nr:DUF1127 domain-containing protein [Kaistiaceae bacterium]HQF31161.1 DUF1127 domain-containing protein [Hyphomicrobiales bacterium]
MSRPFEPISEPVIPAAAATAGMALFARVTRQVKNLWKNWHDRRALMALAEMPHRQLADLGVTRADLDAALLAPLNESPSTILRIRMTRRRAALRAIHRESQLLMQRDRARIV